MPADRNDRGASGNPSPAVSVVIPTHDRQALLQRTLEGLASQTSPPDAFEVIVVLDRCTDGTAQMLAAMRPPFALRVVALSGQGGPAAARNAGVAAARGALLVFLDDDIEPQPGFVAAHTAAHVGPDMVVIGQYPPALITQTGFFRIALRRWWENMFDRIRRPGHRFSAFDMLTGNVSMPAGLFHRVGGFDPAFICHEDYELGVRLIRAGARFAYAEAAAGRHHERSDLRQALRRKIDEGRADVALGRKHPEMIAELPLRRLLRMRSRRARASMRLAFVGPAAARVITVAGLVALRLLERLRARRQWRRLLDDLLGYWYWRGVAESLGSLDALVRFAEGIPGDAGSPVEMVIDLSEGVPAAVARLDQARPAAARIMYGPHLVGRIAPRPGTEPLAGRHLRPLIDALLAAPLLDAMAQERAIPSSLDAERLRALCRVQPRYRVQGVEPA